MYQLLEIQLTGPFCNPEPSHPSLRPEEGDSKKEDELLMPLTFIRMNGSLWWETCQFSAWPLSLLPGVTWSHLSWKAVYCLAQASVHLLSLRGVFMKSLLLSSFLMINEQAALRVSNVTPESKEMMQLYFWFFFGLSLPPLHPVMEIILVFCCNEFSLFLPSFIQAWIHLFTVKSTVIEVEQAHPFHPLVLWSAWVSKGCCDQLPQSWCLKTIEI